MFCKYTFTAVCHIFICIIWIGLLKNLHGVDRTHQVLIKLLALQLVSFLRDASEKLRKFGSLDTLLVRFVLIMFNFATTEEFNIINLFYNNL